jgi:ABC-2 type transport system permease protein
MNTLADTGTARTSTGSPLRGSGNALAGTGTLVRLALRRDRIMIPAWVLPLALMVWSAAESFASLYRTPAERADVAASMARNASLRALYGPVFDTGIGGLTAWRMMAFAAALTGLMALLLVVRHTREEEESGRLELIGAGAVGRRAPLAAALLAGFGASAALATLVTLLLLGQGATGALAYGLALGATGCVFAAVGAVTAQLTESARAAKGLAGAVLGLAFLLRAAGDAGSGTLSWLSPLGWAEYVRPYGDERWWVLGLFAALTAGLVAMAHLLVARRDLDAALLPSRPGPAGAGPRLAGAPGLAWRLQRGSLWAWTGSYLIAGGVFGAIANGAADLVRDSAQLTDTVRRMGGATGLVDSFLASLIGTLGMVAAVYTVQAVLRLRAEESAGRAEPILATAVGRLRWAGSHLLLAAAGSVVVMLAAGLGMGLGYGASVSDVGGQLPRMAAAGLVQLPTVWLVTAIAVLLYGAAPKLVALSWSVVSVSIGIGLYGPLLKLSHWALDVSPFTHLPKVPAADVTAGPLLWLALLTAGLTAMGLTALRRRDIPA